MPESLVHFIRAWKDHWPLSRGKYLPLTAARYAVAAGVLRPFWYQFQPDLWFELDPRDWIHQHILLEGEYEPVITSIITGLLAGHVFLDIGANAGYFTLLAASKVGPTGKVVAVEPNPATAEKLRRNIARSKSTHVHVVESAVSDSTGTVSLYLNASAASYNSGASSLSAATAASTTATQVRCCTADSLTANLDRLDLVKIDVEGAELGVLRGMEQTIARFHPAIVIEVNPTLLANLNTTPDQLFAFFADRRYTARQLSSENWLFT